MLQNELTRNIKNDFNTVPAIIEKTFPIPLRFKKKLPHDIAGLSRLLTNARGGRSLSYLTRPNNLTAYLYYFLPWNLYRLCLLLPGLNLRLKDNDLITDLGCGPLTFTSALWITYPQLRDIYLEFNCVDRSAPALEAGKKFFASLCGKETVKWKINLIKEDINLKKANLKTAAVNPKNANSEEFNAAGQKSENKKNKKAALVCAVNLFNEIYENLSHNNKTGLRDTAAAAACYMNKRADSEASILTVEPGVPQAGYFISYLRGAFLELNRQPESPCTHNAPCPLIKGQKNAKRWCHFAFESTDAPDELLCLSAAAGLPKERLVFSYLYTSASSKPEDAWQKSLQSQEASLLAKKHKKDVKTRVISDIFPLPENKHGCYGCSSKGLVLFAVNKNQINRLKNGSAVTPFFNADGKRDIKSGALIAGLAGE